MQYDLDKAIKLQGHRVHAGRWIAQIVCSVSYLPFSSNLIYVISF